MKKLFPFLIGLMLILSLVQATEPPVPVPVKIVVKVNGQNINYADTKVTNKGTGEVLTKNEVGSLSIVNGIGLFDLSEFSLGYEVAGRTYAGDEIEIIACNIAPECTKTFRLTNREPKTIEFSITGNVYVCWDGSVVTDPNNCPTTTTTTIPVTPIKPTTSTTIPEEVIKIICEDGTEVENAEDCPTKSDLQTILITLIAAIIGLFAWGKGFAGLIKYYLNKATEAEKAGNKKLAKKYRERAEKMAKTAVTNYLAGKYRK